MSKPDPWNPDRYHQFFDERREPFDDLVRLIRVPPGGRVLDLGCGTGELTQALHQHLQAAQTLGIDNSSNMISKAQPLARAGLEFRLADISHGELGGDYDLIFSNAAIHWVADHDALLARLKSMLAPGGQIAIQLPAMQSHVAHTVAREIAQRPPYREALDAAVHFQEALTPERYAELLFALGCSRPNVRLQIYGHRLPSTAAVVEWMQGTLLTYYEKRLSEELFSRFLEDYRRQLLDRLPTRTPYYFPFRRILIWAQF